MKCSSCRVKGQKSKLSYRHAELEAVKVKKKITGNVQAYSLFSLSSLFSGKVKVFKSCLTLCNPMDCSLSGSSVHEILQARILE